MRRGERMRGRLAAPPAPLPTRVRTTSTRWVLWPAGAAGHSSRSSHARSGCPGKAVAAVAAAAPCRHSPLRHLRLSSIPPSSTPTAAPPIPPCVSPPSPRRPPATQSSRAARGGTSRPLTAGRAPSGPCWSYRRAAGCTTRPPSSGRATARSGCSSQVPTQPCWKRGRGLLIQHSRNFLVFCQPVSRSCCRSPRLACTAALCCRDQEDV